jgi:glycosyltransferase involved in cell wall biosynthesis
MPALVSVVLPVYNAQTTLKPAVTSILRQRHRQIEVIAVDDGSTDSSPAILGELAAGDPRIRILAPGRQGLIGALNAGVAAAQSGIVARMDADDIAHPSRISRQVSYLCAHPDADVVSSLIRIFPCPAVAKGFRVYEEWLNALRTPEEIAREIYIESPLAHPSVTFRRQTFDSVGGYQENGWPEDYDLWLRMHTAGHRMGKVPEVLLHWREGPTRLTRTDSRYSVENFIRAKAHYLRLGPLADRPIAIVWGAGQMGRRLSKHLQRAGVTIKAFVDIDPKKIGNTRRGAPIVSPADLLGVWEDAGRPLILASVPSRGARALIRGRLREMGMEETKDFYCVA